MPQWRLERVRLDAGAWQGRLEGPPELQPPSLVAAWRGEEIAELKMVRERDGVWTATFEIPSQLITDGTQILVIGSRGEDPLCLESLAFGDPLETDLRAEITALRTEIELLKLAFRRHLAEDE